MTGQGPHAPHVDDRPPHPLHLEFGPYAPNRDHHNFIAAGGWCAPSETVYQLLADEPLVMGPQTRAQWQAERDEWALWVAQDAAEEEADRHRAVETLAATMSSAVDPRPWADIPDTVRDVVRAYAATAIAHLSPDDE